MISRRSFVIAGIAVAGCRRPRGGGFGGYAFVANEESRAVAAVDLTAFSVAKHIRLAGEPTQVLSSPSGKAVYVLTPNSGTLYDIDPRELAVRRTLSLGAPALGMRPEPGGEALWIVCPEARRLLRVDPDEMRIAAALSLPGEPVDFDVSNWTGLAVFAYGGRGEASLLSLSTGEQGVPIRAGDDASSVLFRSDGKAVIVANRQSNLLTVLDVPALGTVAHLPLAVRPDHLCVHPDGGQVFITGEGRDAVVVVYPYYVPEVAETVLAGHRPGAMAASRSHLFVTNPAAGDVTIMNIHRRRVVAVAAVGAEPGHVTLTPDNEYALVLNRRSGDMAVIRIAGLQPDRRKSAALFTLIPVGSKPVSAAVVAV